MHRIPDIATWIDQADLLNAGLLTVDLSRVQFIDEAAFAALMTLTRHPGLTVSLAQPSRAFVLTQRLIRRAAERELGIATTDDQSELIVRCEIKNEMCAGVTATVAACGHLTMTTADKLRHALQDVVEDGTARSVVIDLARVRHIDPAALVAVTAPAMTLRRAGTSIEIIAPQERRAAAAAELTGVLPKLSSTPM